MRDEDVEAARVEVERALGAERASTCPERWARAAASARQACRRLRRGATRARVLASVVARRRPVTHRVSCPVDLAALHAFLLTPAATERPKDDFGRPRLGQPSLGEQAQSLIDAATRVRDGEGVIENCVS